MRRFAAQLFDFDRTESHGEYIVFRVLEAYIVACAISFAWAWGLEIRHMESVIMPLGIANYVDISFMFTHDVALISAAAITVTLALGFGSIKPGVMYSSAILLLHLQYVARFSLGTIAHGSHMTGMSLLGLAVAALAFARPESRRRFALGFIYFFVGLGYTLAAWSKLIGTGLHWPDGRHLWMWISERSIDMSSMFGAFEPNILQELILSDYRIGTVALLIGLVTEFFGFLMWFRKTRYIIIPALIAMHMGVTLTMNITFGIFMTQLMIIGVPWAILIDRGHERWSAHHRSPLTSTG